jgi:hypothetical protein
MTVAETLLLDFDVIVQNARRTLERITPEMADWKAHAKSMPMGRLSMHCATLPLFGAYVMEDPAMDMAAPLHPHADLMFKSTQECLEQLDECAKHCRRVLAAASDEALEQTWRFAYGDYVISNDSRARTMRTLCLNHLVHHTAQLGVFLRLQDKPVPPLFGPSADEQWVGSSV